MPEQTQKELNAIVKAMAATGLVSKIILFGSQARGEAAADSDIDLCALTTAADRRPVDIAIELRQKLSGIQSLPLDLLAFDQDKFNRDAVRPTSFAHLITNEGVVLYEQH